MDTDTTHKWVRDGDAAATHRCPVDAGFATGRPKDSRLFGKRLRHRAHGVLCRHQRRRHDDDGVRVATVHRRLGLDDCDEHAAA